ncbi:MAG TPA: chemotaxis protein CheA [Bryobacteraceae bacterium]|nr:chemotaxis protein CheA [Bryobacteraceae bacterium]
MAAYIETRQRVEDLALRLVLATGGNQNACAWDEALEAIQKDALREGAADAASAAASILAAIRAAGAQDPGAILQEGLVRLQRALDEPRTAEIAIAQDPELLSDFVIESREHLANLESQLLVLEKEPTKSEALHAIFRNFHTIKGLAGFLELREIQKVAHEVETVLDQARNGQFTVTPEAIDVILLSGDYLKGWLTHLELILQNQPSSAPDLDPTLLARITAIPRLKPGAKTRGLEALAAAVTQSAPTPEHPSNPIPETRRDAAPRSESMAVKVDTAKLDYLVDMAGEMVIAETLVRHDPELAKLKSPRLQRNLSQLTRITSELQRTAMSMRLVPVGPLFRRMARLVRDLSRQIGKKVEMQTAGDDIELDRTIVEELADPLMHMVRNSLDHGFEMPEERIALGKPAAGRLLLKAQHLAGQVVIELTDDGRGLNREKILAKAIEKGLVNDGGGLSDSEVFELIFKPGFSTAAQVTDVSGRGVGMDVVRKHIEKLRGHIEIRSQAGIGTTFLLKLPLTLAIIEGLVVGVGQERYIVPLFAIREIFRPKADTLWTIQERAEMALVRGSLTPVLRLGRKFGVKPASEDANDGVLVLAEAESQRFCILVDEVIGKQEVVIKALGETFRAAKGIAGGAILGDGRVGLILDLDRLFRDKTSDAQI